MADIIPLVLHVPLGLIQMLWDAIEEYIKSVSNVSDGEVNARAKLKFLTEQDVTLKGNRKTIEQRLKQVSLTLKSLQKQHDKLSTGTTKYFESIEDMNSITRFNTVMIKHQETGKKLKDMSAEEATK